MAFSCLHSLISLLVILTYQATAQFTSFKPDCGNGDHYTANSTYQNNLNALLINLSSNTNIDYGFYNFSYGENSDTVHAIGLCGGDVKPQECRTCLNDSRVQLTSQCPSQKEAIGFSLTCMLRYSNKPIYGIMDDSEVFYQWYGNNATMVEKFNGVLVSLLKGLRSKAASGDSLRKFATGNGTGPNFQSIYALVQCTPDLSEEYCNDCLQGAISRILTCCSGHRNVRIARRSCNIRFEENRFYAAVADTPPLPHAPSADSTPSKDAQGIKTKV